MLNPFCTEYSKQNLPEQMQFTLQALPFLKQLAPVDNEINMKKDYLFEGDVVGISMNDKLYNLQYKSRDPKHTDFVLVAKKLSGEAALGNDSFGFWFGGEKYTFFLQSDYYIERIQNADYLVSREVIEAAEASWPNDLQRIISYIEPKVTITDNGDKIPTGLYWVFIPTEKVALLQYLLIENANPNINFVELVKRTAERRS